MDTAAIRKKLGILKAHARDGGALVEARTRRIYTSDLWIKAYKKNIFEWKNK